MKLYRLDRLYEMEPDNNDFTNHVVDIFSSALPVDSKKLIKACNNKEWDVVYFFAHKMKASIDLFNIAIIQNDIRFVENNAKSKKNLEQLPERVKFIDEIIVQCINQIKEDFNF